MVDKLEETDALSAMNVVGRAMRSSDDIARINATLFMGEAATGNGICSLLSHLVPVAQTTTDNVALRGRANLLAVAKVFSARDPDIVEKGVAPLAVVTNKVGSDYLAEKDGWKEFTNTKKSFDATYNNLTAFAEENDLAKFKIDPDCLPYFNRYDPVGAGNIELIDIPE